MKTRYASLVLPLLLLAACEDKKEEDDRTASGQVLDGTISDAELPLDTVTSQPPLAKAAPKAGSTDAAAEADSTDDPAALDAEQPAVESQVE